MNKNIFILILFALALPVAMFSADSKSHTTAEPQHDVMQWAYSLVAYNCENKSEQSALYSAKPLNMQAEFQLVTQDGKEKNTNVDDELPSFPGGNPMVSSFNGLVGTMSFSLSSKYFLRK